MANYRSAILKVLLTEGGYANDPDDSGGETYKVLHETFGQDGRGGKLLT